MKQCKYTSDYSPTTNLRIIQNVDGDIILKIHGNGEFRIATNGGHLHGEDLVRVTQCFSEIIDILNRRNNNEN